MRKGTGHGGRDGREQRGLRLLQGHEHDEERDGRHARDTRSQAIEAVDEVDDVDEADEVYDRNGIGPEPEVDDSRGSGNLKRVQNGSRACNDAGGKQLPEKLHTRAKAARIIDDAHDHDDREANEHTERPDVNLTRNVKRTVPKAHALADVFDDDGNEQSSEHGDTAQTWHGAAIDAARSWLVNDAARDGKTPDRRNESSCRGKGDGEDQQVVYPRLHAAKYTAFSYAAWIRADNLDLSHLHAQAIESDLDIGLGRHSRRYP